LSISIPFAVRVVMILYRGQSSLYRVGYDFFIRFSSLYLVEVGGFGGHASELPPAGHPTSAFAYQSPNPHRYEEETLFYIGLARAKLISENEGYLILDDFDRGIKYVGRIRWEGKQGRLGIIYVNGRWFALALIEVGVEPSGSIRDMLRRLSISTWIYHHEKYLEAMYRRDERFRHLYITSIKFLAETLWSRGVRKLYIGYPYMLSQNNGNEYNTNIWWFRKIVLWIADIFMEYGIDVDIAPEEYTSQRYSIYGIRHKSGRIYRGLYMCRKNRKKINADINAALNIARKLGHWIKLTRKTESYVITLTSPRLQVVILIVIPFRWFIVSPIYSGLHPSFGGQLGWPEPPQSKNNITGKLKNTNIPSPKGTRLSVITQIIPARLGNIRDQTIEKPSH